MMDAMTDAISCLPMAAYGLTMKEVGALPAGAAERLAARHVARRELDNAVRDFITIVATTDLIAAGEERLRLALIVAVQTMSARPWETTATGSDAEFNSLQRGEETWTFALLSLLRDTRRPASQTDEGRSYMMHDVPAPKRYRDERHQQMFESLVQLARKEVIGGPHP
jgi:hypothetical protein